MKKLFLLLIGVLIIALGIVFFVIPKEVILKKVIEHQLSNEKFRLHIDNISYIEDKLICNNIKLFQKESAEEVGFIDSISVNFNLYDLIFQKSIIHVPEQNIKLSFSIYDDKTIKGEAIIKYKHDLWNNKGSGDIKININSKTVLSLSIKKIKDRYEISNLHIDIQNSSLNAIGSIIIEDNQIQNINIKTQVQDFSILSYQAFADLCPENKLFKFLYEFIRGGKINGEFFVFLDKNHPVNVSGNLNLTDGSLKYDDDYPVLTEITSSISIKDTKVNFDISHAKSNDLIINKGDVSLDWKGLEDTNVNIKATGEGPAKGLCDFIGKDDLKNFQNQGIDLSKLNGTVNTIVNITIPLKEGTENIYNIKADLNDVSLNILKDNIILTKGFFKGECDTKTLKIYGTSLINKAKSDLNYFGNLISDKHKLNIDLPIDNKHNIIPGLVVTQGKTNLNVDYLKNKDKSNILIHTNLTPTSFKIDYLSLNKPINKKTFLEIKSDLSDHYLENNFHLSLLGDKLNINGKFVLGNDGIKLDFPNVNYDNNKLNFKVNLNKQLSSIKVKGDILDLSNIDILKSSSTSNNNNSNNRKKDFTIQLNTLKFIPDYAINNFNLNIQYDKNKYQEGKITGQLQQNTFEAKRINDIQWIMETDNIGLLCKTLGLTNSIYEGKGVIKLENVKNKENRWQWQGKMTLSNFKSKNNSVLSKIISLTSIPGLVNILNNEIYFAKLKGHFKLDNNILHLSNFEAESSAFSLKLKGKIDMINKKIILEGYVFPSLYGLNSFFRKIPILNKILSGKKRKGLVFIPFSIEESF